ncbi:MAG: DUF2905 domain-containing protein [candidate division WOR-3 bacterium]
MGNDFLTPVAKFLIFFGLIFLIFGLALFLLPKIGFFRLPGDILWKKKNFTFYFPLSTSLILSLLLTIILNIIFRIKR